MTPSQYAPPKIGVLEIDDLQAKLYAVEQATIGEFELLRGEVAEIRGIVETATSKLEGIIGTKLHEALDQLAEIPARVEAVEALVKPLQIDPNSPVEYRYMRGDGILVTPDLDDIPGLKAAGVRLYPFQQVQRADGRLEIAPPPVVKS